MATNFEISCQRIVEVANIIRRLRTRNPRIILSALGHPNYGVEFSAGVLLEWMHNPAVILHDLVYAPENGAFSE